MNSTTFWIEALGLFAACLTTSSFLPQAIRIWRTRSARDVSLTMYLMMAAGNSLWLAYGALIGSVSMIFAYATCLMMVASVLVLKVRDMMQPNLLVEIVAAEAARQFAEIEPVLAYDTEFSRARTRRIYDRFQRNVEHNTAFLRDLLARIALRVTVASDGVRLVNEAVAGAAVETVTVRGAAGEAVQLPVGATVAGRYRDRLEERLVAADLPFTPVAVEVTAPGKK